MISILIKINPLRFITEKLLNVKNLLYNNKNCHNTCWACEVFLFVMSRTREKVCCINFKISSEREGKLVSSSASINLITTMKIVSGGFMRNCGCKRHRKSQVWKCVESSRVERKEEIFTRVFTRKKKLFSNILSGINSKVLFLNYKEKENFSSFYHHYCEMRRMKSFLFIFSTATAMWSMRV